MKPFYVSDIIISLQNFFNKKYSCFILPSYDLKKGAATLNPHLLLTALKGKENVMIPIEKSYRCNDSLNVKIGCRLSTHHQFEILLNNHENVSVENIFDEISELLDLNHILFLEDNWGHELLLAKGIGWEVTSQNLEFCQATYFYEIGGIYLPNKPLELAFGIERLSMLIQNVDSVFDLKWSSGQNYKDIFGLFEDEASNKLVNNELLINSINACKDYIDKNYISLALEELLISSNLLNQLKLVGMSDEEFRKNMLIIQQNSKLIFYKLKNIG